MNTCKTCKYWEAEGHVGWCNVVLEIEGQPFVPPDGMGMYGATSGNCTVGLVTGPDFGCVRHEPK